MTTSNGDIDDLPPPSHPPPLLSEAQIIALARQGHIPLELPPALDSLYTSLSNAASTFFDLPQENKTSTYAPANGTELGYVFIAGEKQYISFRSLKQPDTELEKLAAQAWLETYNLLYRILGDLAWAMNMNHEAWDRVLDGVSPMPGKLEDATPTLLRMFRYEPDTGIAERHTDLGLLTLCVGDAEGLEVLVKDEDGEEQWIDYGRSTLLVGQTLRILSGNRVRAGVHRVVGNSEGRCSTVFALRPSTKHEIDMTVFPDGQGTMHMGDLWKTIWKGAYNVNAPKAVREKQKERKRLNKGKGIYQDGPDDQTNSIAAIS
jgi:isopenicillin N synthase-like dioxygenase